MSTRSTNPGAGTTAGTTGAHVLFTRSECKLLTIGDQRFFIQITTTASVLPSVPTKVITFPKKKKPTTIEEKEIS